MNRFHDHDQTLADLGSDETMIWQGRANSDKLLKRSDYAWVWIGIVLATVAFAALIASVMTLFGGQPAGAFVGLIGSALLGGLALYLIFGRFAKRYARTRRAAYGITSTRVLALKAPTELGGAPHVTQIPLSHEITTNLETHYDGRGTITVGELQLENIDDAAVVFELLQAQIAQL